MRDEAPEFARLIRAVVEGDSVEAESIILAKPELAVSRIAGGATRQNPTDYFFPSIGHYLYEGDAALHAAAGGYRDTIVHALLRHGAAVRARNRRGAEALHYAADGGPGTCQWNPEKQSATIHLLVDAGADVNSTDANGASPLHRAVRTRCSRAVETLLLRGADPKLRNHGGSTPLDLAVRTTGRGGSGTPEAKDEQKIILRLLNR
jgi:hypothetical protein